jgi:transcriptional regulator with XRE-family HTH domain
MASFEEVLDRAFQNPEIRAEWDRTQLARDVAIWLLRYRIEHNLTQVELADILGCRQTAVARLEGGDHEPSIATLHTLAERLGTTATVAVRPEGVQVRFSKPRSLQKGRRRADSDHSLSTRQRRGPRRREVAVA